jgi:hypothetical protein
VNVGVSIKTTRKRLRQRRRQVKARFAFEKFPQADPTLTTQMKSVGEAMAVGRTFKESLQKCLRSLEIGRSGLAAGAMQTKAGMALVVFQACPPRASGAQ